MKSGWAAGLCFMGGFHMFVQDLMGLEMYIQYLRNHWVDLSWWVGFSIMVLGLYWGIKEHD